MKDPWASRGFYAEVLGFMGYRQIAEDHSGFDFALPGQVPSIGLKVAEGPNRDRPHDRYSPGLHHVAFRAQSREDVDGLHAILQRMGARILDAPADYPQYGAGYYAVFFADPDGLKLEFVFEP
ncbi:VOC family protein [Phenylobacterium terrae]|uniref:VOC family protein n=1 Tax=Phenylobacterium terrae TaxID=2665495 RepID=A0ABW4N389_9CAUL